MSRPIHQKLIAWASGMVEFIGDRLVPEGAIHICTAHDKEATDKLFGAVRKAAHLIEYGDQVGLCMRGSAESRSSDCLMKG